MIVLPEHQLSHEDHYALERLVLELAYRIDRLKGEKIEDLYTEDGVLEEGEPRNERWVGREQLTEWGRNRLDRALHMMTNLRFAGDGPDRATGSGVLTVYYDPNTAMRADDLGTTVPAMCGALSFVCVRTDNGWRFATTHCDWYCVRHAVAEEG